MSHRCNRSITTQEVALNLLQTNFVKNKYEVMRKSILLGGFIAATYSFIALIAFIVLGMVSNCFGLSCVSYKIVGVTLAALTSVVVINCLRKNCFAKK